MKCRLVCVCLAVLMAIATCSPVPVYAQRRGEVVEGLLRGFLEAQLERERRKTLERQQLLDRQRNQPAPPPTNNVAVSVEVRNYRDKLGRFAQQSASLVVELQRSSGRVRGVRPLMADALSLKTRAALMYEESQRVNDLALLREEYCDLDCEWRETSFQLQQLRGLDAATLGRVRQLNGYCDELCQLLELEPQFDREAVFRLTVETTTHLGTLLEDIHVELYGRDGHAELERECRSLAQQGRRLGTLTGEATYDELITKYSTFVTDWRRFAVKIYPIGTRHCDRSIRRIRACNQEVFEHLWTPLSIDRDYLHHVSHAMANEVNTLFDNMTVKALVQLPPSSQQAVLQTARALYGQCEHYCECVENNVPLNELMSEFVTIETHWQRLDGYLTSVSSSTVVTSRHLISAYGSELRGLLRVPARLDREEAIRLAASLEELAGHLRYDTRRYGRYYSNTRFRATAYSQSDAFYNQARDLHAHLQRGSDLNDIRTSCDAAVTRWESFSGLITAMPKNGLSASRYNYVNESRQEVLPVIAELATLLGS